MNWLKDLYAKLSFQSRYDRLKAMKWTPAQQQMIDEIWELLGPSIQKALWALVTIIISKYGPEVGQRLFQSILDNLKKQGVEVA
jgi:hypothetical protein